MNKGVMMLLAAALTVAAACSKSGSETQAVKSEAGAAQVNYKMICERLVPLAPEARKATFSQSCETYYQSLLPACRNAAAVNDCFAKLKAWEERLACMDSCVRTAEAEKK